MVALKDTEATFTEFYCLTLIAVLSTLDNVVLLCLWSVALIVCLINLQFENIGLSSFLAKYCCIVVGSGCWRWCFCVCIARGDGGEWLQLRFGLIIVSTTFIVCSQVVKLTVAYKNNLYSLLLEILPAGKDCSHIR